MGSALSAVSLLWIAWFVSWALASRWTAKTVAQQSASSRMAQSLPIWMGAILLFRSPGRFLATPLVHLPLLLGWCGVLVVILGLAFTWWARISLGRNWSAAVTLKAGHALIHSGPYALTRHPIYTGILLALCGTALARNTEAGVIGVALILVGLILKLREEEQFMTIQFGADYDAYKKDVPALIPGVW